MDMRGQARPDASGFSEQCVVWAEQNQMLARKGKARQVDQREEAHSQIRGYVTNLWPWRLPSR
jgi:hypothetical protein